jgi:cGMP-dependent protein kinase
MVDHQGYLKLINLPTAKILEKDTFGNMKKTFTIIGTPHYMAPEIVIGKGYNNLVDLWSLGICVYEFLCGVLPFGDSSEDAYEIYEEIMQSEINFP